LLLLTSAGIPPRDNIHDDSRRLTLDLRLRSGTSLYLSWGGGASARARSEPALRDELLAAATEFPKLATPSPVEYEEDEGLNSEKEKRRDEAKSGSSKESVEKRLKGLLRLGKK
jgi:tether containing UBX domain for GLUT4